MNRTTQTYGAITHREILQQPDLWPVTLDLVAKSGFADYNRGLTSIVTGAGTSAYAAAAVASSWTNARSIPSTDLLLMSRSELERSMPHFGEAGLLVSMARSGDSPESVAVVARLRSLFPGVRNLAIICNQNGRLADLEHVDRIVLDARTNDQSLVMTSSFSNLTLAGMAVSHHVQLAARLPEIVGNVRHNLPELNVIAERLASGQVSRIVVLATGDLSPLAAEACLKILEITAGETFALPETFLGLRHGPMSFLRPEAMVLAILSSDPAKRRFEQDLLGELKQKNLGRLVVIGPLDTARELFDDLIPANAPDEPDYLRVPFEIVFPQLFAYHLSLRAGLNPDNPSPGGVITRVVKGFQIHGAEQARRLDKAEDSQVP